MPFLSCFSWCLTLPMWRNALVWFTFQQYRFATPLDVVLTLLAAVMSLAQGVSFPLLASLLRWHRRHTDRFGRSANKWYCAIKRQSASRWPLYNSVSVQQSVCLYNSLTGKFRFLKMLITPSALRNVDDWKCLKWKTSFWYKSGYILVFA